MLDAKRTAPDALASGASFCLAENYLGGILIFYLGYAIMKPTKFYETRDVLWQKV